MTKIIALWSNYLLFSIFSLAVVPVAAQEQYGNYQQNNTQQGQPAGPQQRLRLRQFLESRGQGQGQSGEGRMGASRATVNDPSRVKLQKDLAYGTEPRQKLDVYAPVKQNGLLPVILFAHGGGWQIGNKGLHSAKGNSYAENGVIFVACNYRLAPEAVHPKQIQDLASALAWVKTHATEIGADPKRIYLMGHSAGAQLVDLLGTNDRFLFEKNLSLQDVRGVISLDTASLNLAERINEGTKEGAMVGGMIQNAFGTDAKVLADASPTLCIKAGKRYPPFLMFCGERRKSCVAQHDRFAEALKKVGGQVVVKAVPLSHSEISDSAGQPQTEIFQQVLKFVKS